MFGGSTGGGETWEYGSEQGWVLRAPGTSPPPREGGAMAYDAGRGRIVLFGGYSSGELFDTWEYDGTTWSPVTTSTDTPPKRTNAAMAYDAGGQRILMFGGRYTNTSGASFSLDDTWVLAGGQWTLLTLTTSPSPRELSSIVWDPGADRLLLFGGRLSGTAYNDTYRLDATTWTMLSPATSPPVRFFASVVYDSANQRTLALNSSRTDQEFVETWQLDEPVTWTQLAPIISPPARAQFGSAFDQVSGRVVLFGGSGVTTSNETWTLGYTPLVAGEACSAGADYDGDSLVGCADVECAPVCTTCGNSNCDPLENCRSCPADCAVGTSACPITCGDTHCDSGEDATSCPGDCS